jgi:hypothetical protein
LKVDIGGAEAIVFGENTACRDKVEAIAIELHDDSSFGGGTGAFNAAIQGRGFGISRSGELTICRGFSSTTCAAKKDRDAQNVPIASGAGHS